MKKTLKYRRWPYFMGGNKDIPQSKRTALAVFLAIPILVVIAYMLPFLIPVAQFVIAACFSMGIGGFAVLAIFGYMVYCFFYAIYVWVVG